MDILLYCIYFALNVVTFLVAVNILTTGRSSKVNIYFVGLLFSAIAWNITLFFALPIYSSFTNESLLFFSRLAYGFSVLAQFFLVLFSYQIFSPVTSVVIWKKEIPVPKWIGWVLTTNVIVLALLSSFTPLVYEAVVTDGNVIVQETFGPMYTWYTVNYILSIILAVGMIWLKSPKATGLTLKKLRLLLVSYVVVDILMAFFNIILPTLGNTSFYLLGGVSYQVFSITVLYGVVRYKLLGTRLMFWKALHVLLFITLITVLVFLAYKAISYVPDLAVYAYIILPILAIVLYLIGNRLFLKNFYRGRSYHVFKKNLRELTADLESRMDLKDFEQKMEGIFNKELAVEKVEILAVENVLEHMALAGYPNNELTEYLAQERKEIVLEEWKYREMPLSAPHLKMIVYLTVLNAEVCIPLLYEKTLIGMFIVGSRTSKEPYYGDEIEEFKSFAKHISSYLVSISLSQKGQRTQKQLDKTKELAEDTQSAERMLDGMQEQEQTQSAYEVIRRMKSKESTIESKTD